MSDNSHIKNKAEEGSGKGVAASEEWKPLNVEHLESFDNESFFEPSHHGADEMFSALYEADHSSDGGDTFAPFIDKTKDAAPQLETQPVFEDEPVHETSENITESGHVETGPEPEPEPEGEPESSIVPLPDFEALKQEAMEEGFKKGEAEGFAKGEQDGLAAGRGQIEDLVNHLGSILTGVESLWGDLLKKYENSIIQLVCRAAEKVVYGQAETDHDIVRRSIINAFEMIPNPEELSISVNPDDYEYIEAVKEDFFTLINDLKQVSVISDPGVSRGGCQIESTSGTVKADLESRLEAIKNSIMQVNKEKMSGGL